MRHALVLLALASGACATARNYLNPDGPRFEAALGRVQDADPALRVVTFNIENSRRIRQAIAGLEGQPALRGADVLALQEMNAAGVEDIARALSLNAIYFPASNLKGHDRGNALLSPWPIEASWKVLLPHLTRIAGNSRAATAARISISGRSVVVYSVHLGSPFGLSSGKRREQAQAVLADALRAPEGVPVIVAGDFNSPSVGRVFEDAHFGWPTKHVGASTRLFSFDHVFTRGLPADGASAGVARAVKDASDHYPVWAVLPPPE